MGSFRFAGCDGTAEVDIPLPLCTVASVVSIDYHDKIAARIVHMIRAEQKLHGCPSSALFEILVHNARTRICNS